MLAARLNELNELLNSCVFSTKSGFIEADEAIKMAHFLLYQTEKVQGITYVVGNGGSAGIASHFCTDLLRTLEFSASVFSDSNILTCIGNDFGFDKVYSLPLERNLRSHDLLVAISSSGKSENILNAATIAKERKIPLITLTGFSSNNPLRKLGDLNFWADSFDYGLVESCHFFLLHTIVDTCKKKSERLVTLAN